MASACWELYCLEHGISPDGKLEEAHINDGMVRIRRYIDGGCVFQGKFCESPVSTFFRETGDGRCVPRTILCDLEPSVVGEMLSNGDC